MATSYHVYRNDGAGDPVDYSTPIATIPSAGATLVATLSAPGPGDWSYAVRAFDPATGLEEKNVLTRTRVLIGPLGQDQSSQPRSVAVATAEYRSPGSILLRWHYPDLADPIARRFRIRLALGSGPVSAVSTPVATVGVVPGQGDYFAQFVAAGSGPWSVTITPESSGGVAGVPLALAVASPVALRAVDPVL